VKKNTRVLVANNNYVSAGKKPVVQIVMSQITSSSWLCECGSRSKLFIFSIKLKGGFLGIGLENICSFTFSEDLSKIKMFLRYMNVIRPINPCSL
jgi:hypothetical protein